MKTKHHQEPFMRQVDKQNSLRESLHSSWLIIKLVVPIYIISDILYYYNTLSYIAPIFEPVTSLLGLPVEASLSLISGVFLNLYAAVAFAAPLDMSIQQWTVLAIFLGVCHSLVVEGAIIKKLGFPNIYSYSLRLTTGLFIAFVATMIPERFFTQTIPIQNFSQKNYNTITELLYNSSVDAILLSIKIAILITMLIFLMNFIKNINFIKKSKQNINKSFSILVGLILGITFGAGVLISHAKHIDKNDMFFIVTFLMICHAILEDSLLFLIFGADGFIIIIFRTIGAILFAFSLTYIYKRTRDKQLL